ncbi:MAG: hypothetical protein RL077_552, partial [Verrucomicrobiota bacterium]
MPERVAPALESAQRRSLAEPEVRQPVAAGLVGL